MDSLLIEHLPASRRTLRLAVVTETYPPDGNVVADNLQPLLDGLCARSHQIQLIRPRPAPDVPPAAGDALAEVLTGGMPMPRYPGLRLGLSAKRALIAQWTLHRPDVVHLATAGPLAWAALQAALKLKIPASSDCRANLAACRRQHGPGWLKKPLIAYLRKLHNRTQLTTVPSEAARGELLAGGFRNLHVLPGGVDCQRFSPARRRVDLRRAWGAADGAPVLLHAGRLDPVANLPALAAAYEAVRRQCPAARLVLLGDGPERKAWRHRLPDAIFAAPGPGEALAAHYASADLYLHAASAAEGQTLAALASGLPVVAFDSGAAHGIRHGHDGLLASPGQNDEFAARAGELASRFAGDAERFRAFGRSARHSAEARDWRRLAQQFECLLLALAGGTGAAGVQRP